jgi:hypothetical protein
MDELGLFDDGDDSPTNQLPPQRQDPASTNPRDLAIAEVERWKIASYAKDDCGNPDKAPSWWWKPEQCKVEHGYNGYRYLPRVADSLFGMKPGAGGLECDIGGIADVVTARRGSLGVGMVEVAMLLKLNKTDLIRDPSKVPGLGKRWKEHLPNKRPDYPSSYFDLDADDLDADADGDDSDIGESSGDGEDGEGGEEIQI